MYQVYFYSDARVHQASHARSNEKRDGSLQGWLSNKHLSVESYRRKVNKSIIV